jgi:amino acid adenylation domain-containing protein
MDLSSRGLDRVDSDQSASTASEHDGCVATTTRHELIHTIFELQAERTPSVIALVCGLRSLSYSELNARANQLARYLRDEGVRPDQLVGISCERSPEFVIGVLGILKAGGAYLPIDPDYPARRSSFLLEDAEPTVLLTQRKLRGRFSDAPLEVVALDDDWPSIAQYPIDNLPVSETGARAEHLAYVIYTSGSTGEPKGVMIEHRNVLSFWHGLELLYDAVGSCERIALNASFSFDASVQQLVQLLSGRTIVLLPQEVRRDALRLRDFVAAHDIQGIDCTPSQLKSWLAAGLLDGQPSPLRLLLVGGEAIDGELWRTLSQLSAVKVFNVYGPTECTVDATAALVSGDATMPHIGKPMANSRAYIVNDRGEPVAGGAVGEIHVGGAGVGRGYWKRPELTARRFVRNPFTPEPAARMYRTGDLGRWRSDGNIEYLGRNDQQVKLRGFRIELGEIESLLRRYEGIEEAVAVVREDVGGDGRLVAYFTSPAGCAPSVQDLRSYLRTVLPDYMVPSALVCVEQMPLTPSGKLDRSALPKVDASSYTRRIYERPRTDIEKTLAGIWESLFGIEQIGRDDNFYELGGHSLLIARMLVQLQERGLRAETSRLFASATLAEMAESVSRGHIVPPRVPDNLIPLNCPHITPRMLPLIELRPEDIACIVRNVPGGAANVQDIYPLAPLQEGILFHQVLSQVSAGTYVVPTLLAVASRDRLQGLVAALQAVIDRHDILRTAVLWEQLPRAVQVVYRRAVLTVEEDVLDPDRDPDAQVREWLQPERQQLDLRRAPLMRLRVAQNPSSGEWFALLQSHHITSDHVTLELVTAEIVTHLQGRARHLPAALPYRDHVAHLVTQAGERASEAFFRRKLASVDEPTAPFGLLDVHGDGTSIEESTERVDMELARALRAQARQFGVSVATLFHAAWSLVVARTSGRDDVVFGTVLLGRLQSSIDARRVLGLFINTLPIRLCVDRVTARQLVVQTQRELAELLDHEQTSLAVAQRCSGLAGCAPLFSTLLNYAHSTVDPQSQWSAAGGVRMLAYQERTNYPITVSIEDDGDAIVMIVQTDRRIQPARVAGYLKTAAQSLVRALREAPETLAVELEVLPQLEREQLIESFNPAPRAFDERLLHELLAEQVASGPDRIAVTCEGRSLTYAELNRAADGLARQLRRHGVGPDDLVALCVDRSLDLVIGIVGILKAGGAYLPLDPSYPADRLAYVLTDARPRVVLTQQSLLHVLPASAAHVALVEEWSAGEDLGDEHEEVVTQVRPHHLAYVIYTSGSTGMPKGVMVEHRNVTGLFAATDAWFHFHERDVWTLFHSFAFDFSVWELWGALLYGGRVVVVPQITARSPRDFYSLLCDEGVTVLNQTPSAFAQLIGAQARSGARQHVLRYVIFGGEALEFRTLRPWIERNGAAQPRLINMYGITETTVHVTYRCLTREEIEAERGSVIGVPIPDLRVYVLNRHMQPVPIGVCGELCVAGRGVARGYLHRPELTGQRFVPDPFDPVEERRIYKSGDLGRRRADGELEYVGRNDEQIKIRGYRIELGEIEVQLAALVGVREAVVVARQEGAAEKRLVAYVVASEATAVLEVKTLRSALKAVLPEYMVPSAFVLLDRLPLTANGKLDRRSLPAPEPGSYASREYDAPQGEIETRLARIWSELLTIERIGREDDFFALGGHSISGMQLIARIGAWLSIEVPMKLLFQSPTLRELAAELAQLRHTRVLAAIADSANDIDGLLEELARMPDTQVKQLIERFRTEGRW